MQSDTHIAGAAAIQSGVLLTANIQNPDLVMGSMVIVAGGALFPDFDHAGSYISNRYPLLGWVGKIFQHRGFSHTLFFWFLMTIGCFFGYRFGVSKGYWQTTELIHPAIAIFVTGGLSHLLLDSLTPSGVPWLGPFSWNRYSLDVCKTGSLLEWLIKIGFIGFIVVHIAILQDHSMNDFLNAM